MHTRVVLLRCLRTANREIVEEGSEEPVLDRRTADAFKHADANTTRYHMRRSVHAGCSVTQP
jgi:hypothetical protein